jgi:2-polyprenyl-3-methyl-5-hydroxy-6-metoxy-1,4-benzoquinol methylase
MQDDYSDKQISYYSEVRSDVVDKIDISFKRILDVGCGSGATLKYIKELHPESEVVGIEGYVNAAEIASAVCDKVFIHDLNFGDFASLNLGLFDVILFSDVLEHLLNPDVILRTFREHLKRDGRIIVSLPNVRFVGVILPLIFLGRWTYSDRGVLDRTHLRFYTKSSGKRLIANSGFSVLSVSPQPLGKRSFAALATYLTLGLATGFTSRQYIYVAKKDDF